MATHTLLAISGRSPQVITEAIYGFYTQFGITFDSIKVITSKSGKDMVWQGLMQPRGKQPGMLQQLTDDYQLPSIEFLPEDILVPSFEDGNYLEDVKSESELICAADFILNTVSELTNKSEHLHTLLAGGRKTTAFYVGYAMTLYARKADTLNHVFVSEEYEHSEFYYPTPYSLPIYTAKGQYDAACAEVTLSAIPFLRMRDSFPNAVLEQQLAFSEAVALCNSFNNPVSLAVDMANRTLVCSDIPVMLSKPDFAFYLVMLDDLLNAREGFDCPAQGEHDALLALLYLNKRLMLAGHQHEFNCLQKAIVYANEFVGEFRQNELDGLVLGIKSPFFHQRKRGISQALRKQLPEVIAEHYDIDTLDKITREGATKKVNYFGILLDPALVKVNSTS
jgi:CRISPR-associated protein (TIGR02584 family)